MDMQRKTLERNDMDERLGEVVERSVVLQITPEELSTLQLLAVGKTGSEIAGRTGTTERELERRLTGLFARMGVATPVEAVNDAYRRGLLTRDDGGGTLAEGGVATGSSSCHLLRWRE
jgi:DNA-binding NarL/FixJ family response regulator